MMSFRPQTGNRYLDRPRLLQLLPEQPGFVVWLEAPYGYGKSVLASQWAGSLEQDGWRVIWLAADASDVRRTVAAGLSLPKSTPWEALLEALWSQQTVLVLEDLENLQDHEELVPLLRDPRGLLLLASRGPLRTSEIPRLITTGRLTHLQSEQLGFTRQETSGLIPDPVIAGQLWAKARGWPLPLHFASLMGKLPDGTQLLSGLKASMGDAEWLEALLLATVPYLPADSATVATTRLAANGFVQPGDSGYRLHALVAEHILATHAAEAGDALKQASARLPRLVYGEALEKLGDLEALADLLEEPLRQVNRQAPEAFLRWDSLLPGPVSARRHVTAGSAATILGRNEDAVRRLTAGIDAGDLSPDEQLFALKGLAWAQGLLDHAAAAEVVARGEDLLDRVDPEMAGRFLSDVSYVDVVAGDYPAAIARLERALKILPAGSAFRTGTRINLALNRWDSLGDYDGRLWAQTTTLPDVWKLYPSDAPGQCRDIAMMHAWAGNWTEARSHLEQAAGGERANPLIGLEARAALAALDGDASAFPALMSRALNWNSDYALDVIAMHAINTVPEEAATYVSRVSQPGLAAAAWARHHPDPEEALRIVDAAIEVHTERAYQLYLQAARFSLTRSEDDLEKFIGLTTAGARLLPGHVPLEQLPRDRPDLARYYPIDTLLASGWKEAINLRLDELPDLEVNLLGQVQVRLAGRNLDLTERPLQLLILLLLGLRREEAAEAIWPDVESARQRNNLGVQLNALRKQLEPWGGGHFLRDDGLHHVRSDHTELLSAVNNNDADAVLRLYREPFAPGVSLEALEEHRVWLRGRVLEVLQEAAETPSGDATRYLQRLLELDPLNEEALRQLMMHLLRRGRQREARRHYDEFASRLTAETGLEPEASTRALLT